jgi:hypothetical protein
MLDVLKLFLSGMHALPPALRHAFVVLFFTTAVLFAVAFKRWLERRRDYREADLWAEMPVGLAFLQVCLWGAWATAGFYTIYNDDAARPQLAGKPAAARAASLMGSAGSAKARHHSKSAARREPVAPVAAASPVPSPDPLFENAPEGYAVTTPMHHKHPRFRPVVPRKAPNLAAGDRRDASELGVTAAPMPGMEPPAAPSAAPAAPAHSDRVDKPPLH